MDASDGTSSTTMVECSSPEEKCNVFFTTITSKTGNSASVQPSNSGDKNVVAVQFDMNTDISLPKIIINSITVAITSTPSGTPVSTVVGVQGEEDVSAVSSLTLAVITPDSGDFTKHYIDALDVTGITTENIRIPFENIKDNAFLPSTVTMMVAGHDASGASSAFGYVEVTLSDWFQR
nr:uncharacterized protein LOC128702947 [Cherax quadricarinatus]